MKNITTYILTLLSLNLFGQIHIKWAGDIDQFKYKPDSVFTNWSEYNSAAQLLQMEAIEKGFLEFSIDSLQIIDSLNRIAHLSTGSTYFWNEINLTEGKFKLPKYVKQKWNNDIITPQDLSKKLNNYISYFQNNGYPFCSAQLDSLELLDKKLSANINISPGKQIFWDTISIVGDAKIQKYYLENYLSIKKGAPYSEELFAGIPGKLKELPFVKSSQSPKIVFKKDKALIYLFLKEKKANFINGIIGVLPNSNSSLTSDESQLVITGDLKLNLGNSFGYGEKIKINWKRIQVESQELKTEEEIPFILSSPIGFTHTLQLLKQDTSFINYKNRLGIKYDISAKRSFIAFWENEGTNTLSKDAINTTNLSSVSGSKNSYGLQLNIDWLDYKFNPRKGILLNIESKAGIKKISGPKIGDRIKIPLTSNEETSTILYVPESSMLYEGIIKFDAFIPIWKTIVLRLANQSGFKLNDYLLDNDLYRLGGFSTLRGFDQQSIFSTNYSIFTSEIRLLFEENSFLNLFIDQSIIQKQTITTNDEEFPMALGAGINFETKPGIFSISYALGKFNGDPFEFQSAKIHFGFINLF